MSRIDKTFAAALVALAIGTATGATAAQPRSHQDPCEGLPTHSRLTETLRQAVAEETSGLDFGMWATVVNRDGDVCAVAFSGGDRGAQWPGSRVISAQKANTANAFGLDGLALSTANLFSAVQPGGSLYGLQHSNPVDVEVAYRGRAHRYGTDRDPMVGGRIGGVNVFGGGLGLYDGGRILGGLGVSGDTSCADHMIGWRVRHLLGLDGLGSTGGVSGDPARPDNIVYDLETDPNGGTGASAGGFGHPECLNTGDQTQLPAVR